MHDVGDADEYSFNHALTSLEQRANVGNVTASQWLGNMYFDGKSVPKDDEKAMFWYKKAANLGDAHSRNRLKTLEQV